MKLTIRQILILLPTLFFINGCLNYTQITTIKSDNSADIFVHYWMQWNTKSDTLFLDQFGFFEKDSIRKEFESDITKIESIEIFKNFEDSTIHSQIKLTISNIDSIFIVPAFQQSYFRVIKQDDDTKRFTQFISPFTTGFGIENKDLIVKYTYYLPGEIIEHNATETSLNKAVWQFPLSEIGMGKEIYAIYEPFKLKETPKFIYGLALFVIVIVVYYLIRKKR
ncbi:MAG: hypothetical protein K9J16_07210 [Melioribacteraceae bacterium]|nr:hypothetical protein [Melioribacteraceae bacterium]MCF8354947.1 hypothetical protein [Melioribacteraceae bacterium]MCF8392364.1 hypothetical protein [Melioribacteraceae bacterium]MCF8417884.1 hypothetical protein [Melioribacteraceae bacterium]